MLEIKGKKIQDTCICVTAANDTEKRKRNYCNVVFALTKSENDKQIWLFKDNECICCQNIGNPMSYSIIRQYDKNGNVITQYNLIFLHIQTTVLVITEYVSSLILITINANLREYIN